MGKSIFVDYPKLKSLNKSMYVLLGPREVGKTYGWKLHFALRDFVKKGYKFMFVRRFKTQVKLEKDWWGSVPDVYEQFYGEHVDVSQKGNNLYVNGKHAGIIVALSEAVNIKSQEWHGYFNIGVDEFIENYNYQYIASNGMAEPTDYFWKLVGSVFRYVPPELNGRIEAFYKQKGVSESDPLPKDLEDEKRRHFAKQTICMFANAERLANPYFIEFGLTDKLNKDNRVYMDDIMYAELLTKSEAQTNMDELSGVRRLMKRGSYKRIYDTTEFPDSGDINLAPNMNEKAMIYIFAFMRAGTIYYVYHNEKMQYYITTRGNKNSANIYTLDLTGFENKNISQITSRYQDRLVAIVNKNQTKYDTIETRELLTSLFGGIVVRS